ncbi:hypothetical protein MYXO_01147 [Myxococcaceae bacterium]|nr:hypothetical protein MYXO_01147 [Myxococcaceae bacterium]
MPRRLGTLATLFALGSLGLFAPAARAQDGSDEAALAELQQLLDSPAARDANAASDPRAAEAEGMLSGFPPYARQEIDAIVMQIMRESGEGAARHTDAYESGGAAAAGASFSPAVRARISALEKRLAADPAWNTPANMARMRSLFPGFLGAPGD